VIFFAGAGRDLLRKSLLAHASMEEKRMEFLQVHWHCIVPVIAIAVVLFLRGRGRKNDTEK
jgi:hypothetical protein